MEDLIEKNLRIDKKFKENYNALRLYALLKYKIQDEDYTYIQMQKTIWLNRKQYSKTPRQQIKEFKKTVVDSFKENIEQKHEDSDSNAVAFKPLN